MTNICPYLGNRQRPAEVHPWATSKNVCHAVPDRHGAPYNRISKDTQVRYCLRMADGWPGCRKYLHAKTDGVPRLRELPPDAGETLVVTTRCRRRRRRHAWRRRFRIAAAAGGIVLLCMGLGIIIVRIMDVVNRLF